MSKVVPSMAIGTSYRPLQAAGGQTALTTLISLAGQSDPPPQTSPTLRPSVATLTRVDSLLLLDLLQAPQQRVNLHLDLSQLPLDGLQLVGLHWDTQTHRFRAASPSDFQSLSYGHRNFRLSPGSSGRNISS